MSVQLTCSRERAGSPITGLLSSASPSTSLTRCSEPTVVLVGDRDSRDADRAGVVAADRAPPA